MLEIMVAILLSGNTLTLISVVACFTSGLVSLGWVDPLLVCNRPLGSTQPGHLSVGRHSEYQ